MAFKASLRKHGFSRILIIFFLRESAIYTLWGSKPITQVIIPYYSSEDLEVLNNQLAGESDREVISAPYDLDENWTKWKKISSAFPLKNYLLVEKPHPTEKNVVIVNFVNILTTALLFQEKYELFRRVLGHDFDPISLVFELKKPYSADWNIITSSSVLMGLLFGHGEKNSWCFEWKYFAEHSDESQEFAEDLAFTFSDSAPPGSYSLKNFPIPTFASYHTNEPDSKIEQYQKERKIIKSKYEGQDFVVLTLQKLTS